VPEVGQEQIAALVAAIERAERRRKIMLAGYLVALVVLVGGQVAAFLVYGNAPRDGFWGWVFLIPFGAVGAVLWLFGRLARRKT
jgi:hypothetical protein